MKFASGLVIGKFYPLHKGHELLIRAALADCTRVCIAMTARETESIPGAVRLAWLTELFPEASPVLLPPDTPYHPSDCADVETFYAVWKNLIVSSWGFMPEAIFTSEDYGDECARFWGCQHVCVDQARAAVPVSGTAIRANPTAYGQFLSPVVRAWLAVHILPQ